MKTIRSHISALRLTVMAGFSLVTPVFAEVSIHFAIVGNPGNPADSTGFGAVSYPYKISKYEVTITEYAEFLNTKAQSDPYGLYNTNMGSNSNIAGITRGGSAGAYYYTVVAGSGNRPITYVSWFDAARYANWISNGQGFGNTETGTYTLNGATSGIITRNTTGTVWIAGEQEWYKAAYYDPNPGAGGGDNYWLHAMRVNALTNNSVSANYYDGDYVGSGTSSLPTGNGLTNVGAYSAALSNYGTFDQGGNVWEWNDAVVSSSRGLRGGSWLGSAGFMPATLRHSLTPTYEANDVGFRLAGAVPPVAAVTATPNPAAPGQTVSFNASGSTSSGTIVNYVWNWGDGSPAGSGVSATHSFSYFGSFVVTLQVVDNFSQAASTAITVNVNQGNQAPVANAGGGYQIMNGQALVLSGTSSSDPNTAQGDSIVSYQWDLGNNGSFDVTGATPVVSWVTLQSLGFAMTGNYPLRLRVTDSFGLTHDAVTGFVVDADPPMLSPVTIASNNANPAWAKLGDTVTLSFTASEPIQSPAVTMLGAAATVSNPSGNNWTATATVFPFTMEVTAAFYITAVDMLGNAAPVVTATTDTSIVKVDKGAPGLSLPANITVPTSSATGTAVNFSATATDTFDPAPSVNSVPASGSNFPIATTPVNVTATDAAGNSSNGGFTVTVLNSTNAPVFTTAGTVPLTANGFNATGLTVGAMTLGFDPAPGQVLTLVNNTSANPIGGAFTDLADGGTILTTYGGRNLLFIASYTGGDGNDLILTLLNPEIVIEQPLLTDVADGGLKSMGTVVLGSTASLVFTIKNTGPGILNGLTITKSGANETEFSVTASPTPPVSGPAGTTTFTVQFNPATSGAKTAVLHIASDDADENPFDITLTGQALSASNDTDADGLNDAAEFLLATLGYDWQVSQPALVNTLMTHANVAGLYTQPQVQALNADTPLLTRNPATGKFRLTLGIQKSTDLIQFDPFPLYAPDTSINPQGKLEFEFTGPGNAAFFRLGAE